MTAEGRSLTDQLIGHGQSPYLSEGPWVKCSGVGPTKARLAAWDLVKAGAKALVSWGSAAGLISELLPGTLILPKEVLATNGSVYCSDPHWHKGLCKRLEANLPLHTGPLAESPAILTSSSEKTALFEKTGAVAVDMESAAVAAVAYEAGMPFVAIRAIADPVEMTIPPSILSGVDDFGRLRPFHLVKALSKRPWDLFALVRLHRGFRAAHGSLAMVARLTGSNLLAP